MKTQSLLSVMVAGSLKMSNAIERDFFLSLNPAMLTKKEIEELTRLLEKVKKEKARNAKRK
jgi:hypothetical protein